MTALEFLDLAVRMEIESLDIDKQRFRELGNLLAHLSVGIDGSALIACVVDMLHPLHSQRLLQIKCMEIAVLIVVAGVPAFLTGDGCTDGNLEDSFELCEELSFAVEHI